VPCRSHAVRHAGEASVRPDSHLRYPQLIRERTSRRLHALLPGCWL
jgi:hypothetical protein